MQDIQSESHQRFLALFGAYEDSMNGQKELPLHSFRKKAIRNLESLHFPTLRNEDWKYTSVARILQHRYETSSPRNIIGNIQIPKHLQDLDAYTFVFVNGLFQPNLSNGSQMEDGLTILSLSDALALEKWEVLLNEYFLKTDSFMSEPFAQLTRAFTSDGLFIHTEKNAKIERPVHIIHLSDGQSEPVLASPMQLFYAGTGSSFQVIESFVDHGKNEFDQPVFNSGLNHFIIRENANVHYYKLQELSENQFLVHNARSDQWRDSVFTSYTIDLGGRIVRNNLSAVHKGENVLSNLYGISVSKGEQHIDNQTLIDHAVPHCESHEWYKSILDDRSRGVFNGKVLVRKDAQKTNAFQQNNTILLSEQARMDTKPQLEIFADDVRCSHGATIGQMDEDAVFYLRSRGLSKKEARTMLQLAFLDEVTTFIEDEAIRSLIISRIHQKFDQ